MPAPESKAAPLPLAADRAALSNRISLLLASRASLLKTLNPNAGAGAAEAAAAPARRPARASLDDDDELLLKGARPNEGVGYVPDAKPATSQEDKRLRGRLLGKHKGTGAREPARRRRAASESDDDEGRSGLGKRKRPRREAVRGRGEEKEKEEKEPVKNDDDDDCKQSRPSITCAAEDEEQDRNDAQNDGDAIAMQDVRGSDRLKVGGQTGAASTAGQTKLKKQKKKAKKQGKTTQEAVTP